MVLIKNVLLSFANLYFLNCFSVVVVDRPTVLNGSVVRIRHRREVSTSDEEEEEEDEKEEEVPEEPKG